MGLIEGTAAAGHEVSLFCFVNEPPPDDTPLHDICEHLITNPDPVRTTRDRLRDIIFTRYADMARRFWSEPAAATLLTLLEDHEFDVVHAESIEMAVYLLPIQAQFPDLPLIYGSLNAEADLQRTIFNAEKQHIKRWPGAVYSWIQWQRLTRLESAIGDASAHVLAVSEADQTLLAQLSSTPITIVKNGIYVANYQHNATAAELGPAGIVFTGSMRYRPNVDAVTWFATDILPRIKHPDAQFYIVGHRPHPRVEALAEHERVVITGTVDEIAPYWAGAAVYVAPLRMGSGTRFKILEAIAAGCAVVSTTIGAQGLGVVHGEHCLLADTVEDFAAAVQQVLKDAALRARLAAAGQHFVQDNFDWSVIIPHLLKVYKGLERT